MLQMKEATWFEKKVFAWALKVGSVVSTSRLKNERAPLIWKMQHPLADFLVFRNLRNMMGLDKAQNVWSGAAPIAPEVLMFFHSVGLPLRETFGQTENCGPATMHRRDDIKLGTVGKALPGVEVKIADDGEILIKGPNVFQGYYKEPELTGETIRDGWLYTGDVGKLDEEGNLKITDRKKDIIITSGGKNITPQYIENKLKFSPYINDAIAIGDGRKYLTALIMIDKDNVTQYAEDERIPFTTYKSLCEREEIIDLIQQEVDAVNKTLAQVEAIKKFRLIPIELTTEDAEMTATMKLKRKYASERFNDLIKDMY